MPNWCNTSYVFEGNKEEIADLYQKLQSLDQRQTPLVENGFGKLWLGCVVTLWGGDWEKFYCRGEIDFLELTTETTISLATMTAWGDMPEVWDFVLKKYPSVIYYFTTDEPGMCYYATNDKEGKYYPDRFIVEDYEDETGYYDCLEAAMGDVAEIVGKPIANRAEMDVAIEEYNNSHPDNPLYVNEIKVVPNYPKINMLLRSMRKIAKGIIPRTHLKPRYYNSYFAPTVNAQEPFIWMMRRTSAKSYFISDDNNLSRLHKTMDCLDKGGQFYKLYHYDGSTLSPTNAMEAVKLFAKSPTKKLLNCTK